MVGVFERIKFKIVTLSEIGVAPPSPRKQHNNPMEPSSPLVKLATTPPPPRFFFGGGILLYIYNLADAINYSVN